MDYYKTLGIKKSSTPEEIRAAYKALAKKYHPDVYRGNKDYAEKMMQDVNVAYDTLSDPAKREMYDLSMPSVSLLSRNQPKSDANVLRKMDPTPKPAKEKKYYTKKGTVETWNTAPGIGALVFSSIVWLLYYLTTSYVMEILMVVTYAILIIVSIFIFVQVRYDVNIDVFFISIIFALFYAVIYNVVSVAFLYESFTVFENLIIFPLLACVISLMPASFTLFVIRFLRSKKSLE